MAKNNAAAQMEAADDNMDQNILEYSVDISDAERPPVLPIGEYRATITGVEKKMGKDSGRPYLNVKYVISSDDMPPDYVESLGVAQDKTVFGMVFGAGDTPGDRYNMKQFCKATGAPMSNRINPQEFINREVKVQIEHQKDLEGNPQERVRRAIAAE